MLLIYNPVPFGMNLFLSTHRLSTNINDFSEQEPIINMNKVRRPPLANAPLPPSPGTQIHFVRLISSPTSTCSVQVQLAAGH